MSKLQTALASPDTKQRYVRTLFATIADRYDVITVLLSFGRDRAWKRRLVAEAGVRPGEQALDLACGTGDIALALAQRGAVVTGLDVTARMIALAGTRAARTAAAGAPRVPRFVVGDMAALPFAARSASVVTTGYGLRNVAVLDAAVDEIARVLVPCGRLLSLDFNRPAAPLVRRAFLGYLAGVGGLLGWILHRDPDTYRYIAESIRRYPGAEGMATLLRARGFDQVRVVPLLFGLMTLHVARRAPTPATAAAPR